MYITYQERQCLGVVLHPEGPRRIPYVDEETLEN